ncbi:MAG: hypothetical protein PHF67_02570 [Candidatus Nanoarchaeia archaeon]|nr:hypothetical protein [Candidatus Nanoarchaeia archaeon]
MEKKEMNDLRGANISLILDSYNAVFSDFDPRSSLERGISDDFLSECKKAVFSKGNVTELRLLLPSHLRNPNEEIKIKKRLKDHFKKHFREKQKNLKMIKGQGWIWFVLGVAVMIADTFIYEYKLFYDFNKFLFNLLFVMLQPCGWFFFWEGLGKVFIESKKEIPDYEFYKIMSEANIYFLNY